MALTENYDLYYTENNDDPTFLSWRNNIAGPNGNMVKIDAALASVLPSQSGNNGKFLTTNGSAASWATVDALPSQSGNSGKYLTTNGSAASWADAPEEVFVAEYGVTTYADVLAAYNAGQTIMCQYGNWRYPLAFWDDEDAEFYFIAARYLPWGTNSIGYTSVYANNTWHNGTSNYVPTSLTINSKPLSSNITLTASDVGAQPTLPTQSGNSGKYLTTNGTDVSWSTVDSLPSQSGNSGKFLTTNGSAASWATVDALPSQTGNNGKVLGTNGTTASWVDAQGGTSVTLNVWSFETALADSAIIGSSAAG